MKLALWTHRLRWLLPAHLMIATLGATLGNINLPVPSLTGPGGVPVAVIAALLNSVLLSLPITTAWPASRTTPVRSPALVLLGVLAVVLTPTVLLAVVIDLLHPPSDGLGYIGVFAWLFALQLLVASWFSMKYQAVGPVAYVMLCALAGRADSSVQPWAWPLAPLTWPLSVTLGGSALVVALAFLLAIGVHGAHEANL